MNSIMILVAAGLVVIGLACGGSDIPPDTRTKGDLVTETVKCRYLTDAVQNSAEISYETNKAMAGASSRSLESLLAERNKACRLQDATEIVWEDALTPKELQAIKARGGRMTAEEVRRMKARMATKKRNSP